MTILFEGLGSIAQKHISAIRKMDSNALIWALRSSRNAHKYEDVSDFYSIEELPTKPDFIIICTPTQYHREGLQKAIELGIPIIIEKPVFHSIEAIDSDLVNKIKQNQIKTYIACNLRFHPVLQFLKEYLDQSQKQINEVNVYCGSYFPDWRPNRDYREVYSAKNQAGGGIHLELIHELDYTCWLFGKPIHSKRTLASKSSIGIEAADFAHYLLEYKDFYATITLNFYRKKLKRNIEILFEDDTWQVDIPNSMITNDKNEVIFKSDFNIIDTYTLQMQHIYEIVNQKSEPLNSIEESLEILKICLDE
jgi:predicted dehydrogenase